MELPNQPLKTVFNTFVIKKPSEVNNNNSLSLLKLLSGYSRTITCVKDMVSLGSSSYSWNSPNLLNNLQIEIENNDPLTSYKRRLDDTCLDDTYKTPCKKLCGPNTVSQDLACVVGSHSLLDVARVYSTTDSKDVPCTVDNTVKEKVQSVPARKADSRRYVATLPRSSSSDERDIWSKSISHDHDKFIMDFRPFFYFDVDDIIGLCPIDIDRGSDDDLEAFVDSSNNFNEDKACDIRKGDICQTKPPLAHNQGGDRRAGEEIVAEREKVKDELSQTEKEDCVSHDIHFSRSYIEGIRSGKEMSQAAKPLQPHISPSPLVGGRESLQRPHVWSKEWQPLCPIGSPKPSNRKVSSLNPRVRKVRSVVVIPRVQLRSNFRPSTSPQNKGFKTRGVLKPTENNAVKTMPVQKHSSCQNAVKNTIKATPVQKVRRIKPIQASSITSERKVKTRRFQRTVPRPVVFVKEDWQREKRLYVSSVTRHMRENTGAALMTELVNLMNHVADQAPGTNSKQWQHPSDLTRRNYQTRFGNDSTIYTLDQWQNRNCKSHRRFANVPKTFERSPVL